jgi:NADH-quinone oxidoreductase subunit M
VALFSALEGLMGAYLGFVVFVKVALAAAEVTFANPLVVLCCIPLAAACFLIGVPEQFYRFIRCFVMVVSVLTCFWAQYVLLYTPLAMGTGIVYIYPWINSILPSPLHFSFALGVDGISLFFIVLTTLIFPFCFLSIYKKIKNLKFYCCSLLLLESCLLLTFSTSDLFCFYIFFEASLIPMFFIIGVWGSGKERIRAAYYFFFFTLVGSFLFLLAIFVVYTTTGTTLFCIILNSEYSETVELFLFFALGLGFAVKVPMFPFHTWLPEAHVQSPTEGSVILASLMLKLGGYGFLRVLVPLAWKSMNFFYPIIAGLAICGVIFCSLSAVVQVDLKKLIAYSSVAHMNLVLLGIFSLNLQGIQGSIFLMLAHGLVSSGLFFLVGFLYDRHHTRVISYYSGLVQPMPIYTTLLFLFFLANISFPLSANFVGEFLILIGLVQKSFFSAFLAATGIILSAVYSFFAFSRLAFMGLSPYIENYTEITSIEFQTVWYFFFLVLLLGIRPGLVLDFTDYSVMYLLVDIGLSN